MEKPTIRLILLLITLCLGGFLILVGIGMVLVDRKWEYEFPRPHYPNSGSDPLYTRVSRAVQRVVNMGLATRRRKAEQRAIRNHYKNIKYTATYKPPTFPWGYGY